MSESNEEALFVCPKTRKPLRLATARELAGLRQREGLAELENALVRADRTAAYPVWEGIPLLTPESAITLRKPRAAQKTDKTKEP